MTQVEYSLGFNFDPELVDFLIQLRRRSSATAGISEVFGAVADAPLPSARPLSRIRKLSWDEFARQVQRLREGGMAFNFLMNTSFRPSDSDTEQALGFLKRLAAIGVERVTVGNMKFCQNIKEEVPGFHVTVSITYGVNSISKLRTAEAAGADAVYLESTTVNRNFALLRELVNSAKVECRLYANVSCIDSCPVVRQHYSIFSKQVEDVTATRNDAFFAGCTYAKWSTPYEWIQMPWIRPEDVLSYANEGIRHFKLADRLASTEALINIAKSYTTLSSPEDMFEIIERGGQKYSALRGNGGTLQPFAVLSSEIPPDFLDHFMEGECTGRNPPCQFCIGVAGNAIIPSTHQAVPPIPENLISLVPRKLLERAGSKTLGQNRSVRPVLPEGTETS